MFLCFLSLSLALSLSRSLSLALALSSARSLSLFISLLLSLQINMGGNDTDPIEQGLVIHKNRLLAGNLTIRSVFLSLADECVN